MERQNEYSFKKQHALRLLAFGQMFTGFVLVLDTLVFQGYIYKDIQGNILNVFGVLAGSWVCFIL